MWSHDMVMGGANAICGHMIIMIMGGANALCGHMIPYSRVIRRPRLYLHKKQMGA